MGKFIDKVDMKTIVIFGLIIVIFLLNMCSTDVSNDGKTVKIAGKTYTIVKHEIDTVIVPVKQIVYKKGEDIYVDSTIYVEVPAVVDTSSIIQNYYSQVIYKDTLRLSDSLGYIALTDTIFNNSILNRKWESYVNKFTIREVTIVEPLPKNQLYVGGFGGFNSVLSSVYLGPTIMLKNKKDNMFGIGLGVGTGKEVLFQGNIYRRIKLKK
jgi:hypothetical protein